MIQTSGRWMGWPRIGDDVVDDPLGHDQARDRDEAGRQPQAKRADA